MLKSNGALLNQARTGIQDSSWMVKKKLESVTISNSIGFQGYNPCRPMHLHKQELFYLKKNKIKKK